MCAELPGCCCCCSVCCWWIAPRFNKVEYNDELLDCCSDDELLLFKIYKWTQLSRKDPNATNRSEVEIVMAEIICRGGAVAVVVVGDVVFIGEDDVTTCGDDVTLVAILLALLLLLLLLFWGWV